MTPKAQKNLWLILGISVGVITVAAIATVGYRRRVTRKATGFLGIKEIANNSGFQDKAFQQMMRDIGWSSGDKWCMYFAKLVWLEAFPGDEAALNKILGGSTQASYENAVADNGKTVSVYKNAKVGDIVIWQNYSNGKAQYSGHAGIVVKTFPGGFQTIEGNKRDAVSRIDHKYDWNISNGQRLRGFIRKAR